MPTGAGKSEVIASIAADANRNVLILAHRGRLVRQLSGTLSKWGIEHGIIAPGHPETDHACQVGSVLSVVRRLDRVPAPGLIILDEAHHLIRGNVWGKIIEHYPDAYLLGKTATPERLSGEGMGEDHGGYFQSMVIGPTPQWLTDQGFLAKARIFCPPSDLSRVKLDKVRGDFDMKQAEAVAVTITGDAIMHFRQHFPNNETALAFCTTVNHARQVAEEFTAAGIPAEPLDGTMPEGERDAILDRLANKETRVVTSVAVLGEGIDIPGVNGVLLYRPTASLSLHLQMLGRALRVKPDSSDAIILDHVGNVPRLGPPTRTHEWSLEGRAKRKKSDAESVRVCFHCFAAMTGGMPVCPCCGAEQPTIERLIEVQDGELKEYREQAILDRKRERANAQSYEELIAVGQRRGMKNPHGWARHVMMARSAKAGRSMLRA
jgi:DNA repair protein RadD